MRLLKGSINIKDLDEMPRRELLARMEARMRSYKNEDKKTRASRALAEKIEDMT